MDDASHPSSVRPEGFSRTLTPAQLMERLQLSENTVYHELQNGCLKDIAFRIGRQWRVSEAALERLMAGRTD
ncbi:MAG TPA: helix-turn-helix domain-containing protein [Coriobacteriia bacterium]|nr:helix-turn-helix domain-containing protein [Coriobacteriia bacterium]